MVYRPSVKEQAIAGKNFLHYIKDKHDKKVLEIDTRESCRVEYTEFRATDLGRSFRGCAFSLIWRHLRYTRNIIYLGGKVVYPCYSVEFGLAFDQRGARKNALSSEHNTNNLSIFQKKSNALLDGLKKQRDFYVKNKNSIEIMSNPVHDENGSICLDAEPNSQNNIVLFIYNKSNDEEVLLKSCKILRKHRILSISPGQTNVLIEPGFQHHIKINCKPKYFGMYRTEIVLEFNGPSCGDFHIARYLTVRVTSQVTSDLGPLSPYKRPKKISQKNQPREIVDGVKPPSFLDRMKLEMKSLDPYLVSKLFRTELNKGNIESLRPELKDPLSIENYRSRFSTLLHVEEVQMEVDIHAYDLEAVDMEKSNERSLLKLRVEGLAENRPSLLKGDSVLVNVNSKGVAETKKYRGYVHRVEDVDVLLGFNPELLNRFIPGLKFDVQFSFNRFCLRIQHHSLENTGGLDHLLFPNENTINSKSDLQLHGQFNYFDSKVKDNEEQRQAVEYIVCGTSRPAPYLIFGPPGTGKTITMVEAVKQVYKLRPDSHILCCAPSNSAADLIAARLMKSTPVNKSAIFRLNALSRPLISIENSLLVENICNYDRYNNVYFPDIDTLKGYRIIITTLITAGRLALAEFPRDHFTHVFVDEAGQAIETEALVPVSGLLNPNNPNGGQLVLVGDPKQLGPVLRSRLAIDYGLDISLLERLMSDHDVYKKQPESGGGYDKRVLTKLLRNYRSHPAILSQPNKMFYDGELQVHADELLRNSLCDWDQLPKKDFPVIFHGVEGDDVREGNSPSYFNTSEIDCVWEYTNKLLEKRGNCKIKERDIGIISPYRRQVQKIRRLLDKKHLPDIKVGTVEEFQGQERTVIIISTVRSNKAENIQVDQKFNLGFLRNPKRFNVAITRAKALLIVIGNPYMLSLDENWNKFLTYCRRGGDDGASGNGNGNSGTGGYTGCEYIEAESEAMDIIKSFSELDLNTDPEAEVESDTTAPHADGDPQWNIHE